MICEFTKKVHKTVHLPPKIEVGSEEFEILESGECNKVTIKYGMWETTFSINNPEEFSKKPVEQVMLMVQSVYDDVQNYVLSTLGDDEATL